MRNNVTQRDLERLMLSTICLGSHSERREGFRQGYRLSIRAGFDSWTLLFRGFCFWIDEEYAKIDEKLLQQRREDVIFYDRYVSGEYWRLWDLLFAHVNRRRALEAYYKNRIWKSRSLNAKAIALYRSLVESEAAAHIVAVALHGLGNSELIKISISLDRLPATKHDAVKLRGWNAAERYYRKSIENADSAGIRYAPPHRRLGWLSLERAYRLDHLQAPSEKIVALLNNCLEETTIAIRLSNGTYAPPILHQARAVHKKSIIVDGRPDRQQTLKLLRDAIMAGPLDQSTHTDIEEFARALRSSDDRNLVPPLMSTEIRLSGPVRALETMQDSYVKIPSRTASTQQNSYFIVLKRWSSYTPLNINEDHETVGGGYILDWLGYRVAIDPGIGFIRNLHRHGYKAHDFDALIMSHQHIDHSADFETILAFLKQYSKAAESGELGNKLVKILVSESGRRRWDKVLLPQPNPVIERLRTLSAKDGRWINLAPGKLSVKPTPTFYHRDMLEEGSREAPSGFGLLFSIAGKRSKCMLGITSDTGYVHRKNGPLSRFFKECDIVIIHVSTVADLDSDSNRNNRKKFISFDASWPESDCPNIFYKKHMGFWGTVCFIKDLIRSRPTKLRTILLSEIGEEMLGTRMALLDEVRRLVASLGVDGKKQAKRIFIADLNTRIELPASLVMCGVGENSCQNRATKILEMDHFFSGDKWMSHRRWADRSILYVCRQHERLSEMKDVWSAFGYHHVVEKLD